MHWRMIQLSRYCCNDQIGQQTTHNMILTATAGGVNPVGGYQISVIDTGNSVQN